MKAEKFIPPLSIVPATRVDMRTYWKIVPPSSFLKGSTYLPAALRAASIGTTRLPKILSHFNVVDELYLHKVDNDKWQPVSKEIALSIDASKDYSALGFFALKGRE